MGATLNQYPDPDEDEYPRPPRRPVWQLALAIVALCGLLGSFVTLLWGDRIVTALGTSGRIESDAHASRPEVITGGIDRPDGTDPANSVGRPKGVKTTVVRPDPPRPATPLVPDQPRKVRTLSIRPDAPAGEPRRPEGPAIAVAPDAQRAILYEEDPADPNGRLHVAHVVWRTQTIPPTAEQVVQAHVQVPSRMNVTMMLRRNTDPT